MRERGREGERAREIGIERKRVKESGRKIENEGEI